VAVVVDKNNAITFYVNGVGSAAITDTLAANVDTDDVLLIGATTSGSSRAEQFNGAMDELTIVARALDADEVRALAQNRVSGVKNVQIAFQGMLPGSQFYNEKPAAGLALHLPMDDSPNVSGTLQFQDISGRGLAGNCSGERCPQDQQPGHIGNAPLLMGGRIP